jgi:nitrite reductase/ring-hydroxylating ferredoxin subunit
MRDVNIGPASDFADPGRKVIDAQGTEVGVFKLGGEFFAYHNVCPHMGGPGCQGKIIAKVEEQIAEDRTSKGLAFSKSKLHVTCPWHGYEFDIRTGRHPGDARVGLTPVKLRVENGDVILSLRG